MFAKFAKSRFQEEFLALTKKVGHRQPSAFERKVIPFVFMGRDLAIEAPEREDATVAMVLSALGHGRSGAEQAAIVLTANSDSVKQLSNQLRVFTSSAERPAHIVGLGIDENIKRELQLLSRPPDIIVGTPERLIDHIRRENLSVTNVHRVVIDAPSDPSEEGFDKDLLFIYSKLKKRPQTVVFCPSFEGGLPLSSILRRPIQVPAFESKAAPEKLLVYRTESEEEKLEVLCDIFFAEELMDAVVVCRSRSSADRLVGTVSARGIAARGLHAAAERQSCEEELRAGTIRAVVTDSLRSAAEISSLKRLILYEVPSDVGSYADLKAYSSQLASCTPLVVVLAKNEPDIFEGKQEVQYVDTNNRPSNEDILKGKIRSIVKRIKEDEDPDELNKLRKIVRRNVPVFLRGYFMAYLVKEAGGTHSVPSDMKTLFVSIGKNRRVFPRDLSRLFSGTLDINSGSIGNIKVLDNYSFIDIPESLAEKAISALDGKDFRGRKITVNHARKKEEDA